MNTFINYLIEVNLGLVFLYAIYWLLFRSENQFTVKRFFLLGAMLFSLAFPLLTFTTTNNTYIPSIGQTIPTHWLPELVVTAEGTVQSNPTSVWSVIAIIYKVIAVALLVLLLVRVARIIWLLKNSSRTTWKNFTVAESAKISGVFSFFRLIFISSNQPLEQTEKEEVLRHEEVHINQYHSFDIILINLLQVICWFNPVVSLYKTSLVQLHEFEADARSVSEMDLDHYCGLLAKVALQQNGYTIANHFTNSLTLKRITMIRTVKRKIGQWKVASALLLLTLYFVTVACQDQMLSDIKEIGQNSSMALTYPAEVQTKLDELTKAQPKSEFIVIEMNEEGKKKMDGLDNKEIASLHVIKTKESELSYIIIEKGAKTEALSDITISADGVYTVVDESAEPVGGMEKFYQVIGANMKYPLEARQRGIEGRVFIEFVVNEDGNLSDFRTLKGIGAGCDEEALRVIKFSPAWSPGKENGKIVRQRMVLPIVFKLGNSDTKIETGMAPKSSLEEMVVVGHKNN